MPIRAIDLARLASPSDVIYESLREAIVEGRLGEGEVLRQDTLARMFNVSRIPVREALTRLEEQGLVATQRYRGAVVASLSFEEIEEIFEFRALVEPELVRRAIARIDESSLDLARRSAESFAAESDPKRWGDLNREFHHALCRDCDRPYHLQMVDGALDRIERYQRLQLTLAGGMDLARAEHAEILAACVARDADRAFELTRAHIRDAGRSLVEHLIRRRAG